MDMTDIPPAGDARDSFGDALAGFRSSLGTIVGSPETELRIAELYGAYSSVLYEALQSPQVASRAAERYEPYAREVASVFAGDDAREELERAFTTYLGASQQAWATCDIAAIDPSELAAIAAEMQWVAGVMGVVRSIQ
jgi:hypothetical protein